ncbi:nucleoside permease [Pedobacter rhizosphaerae]|uniref:MFS transporter, NHS family, xanthosine permease n=1 Tax=Pedobacter rhizosphaerae TaxID=390241 RepID=A0A1H9S568_9SPHI|nr:nucleoside permease [Pedobacter rhizosphaerae]SER79755.1 MFS transporter, NHS family, xanthosine permease [Pedobacter rhizosphaerae]
MNVKFRLTLMSFMQFFVWAAWLITIANYWFGTKQWAGADFGIIFSTMGIASLFMPTLTGILADKWINAEKLYGILHLLYAVVMFYLPQVNDPHTFFWVILVAMCFYMPTIALSNSISYTTLKNSEFDVVKDFPPIRVWGTIGFIVAMWITNLTGNKASANQFYIAGVSALALGLYSFTLPACKPSKLISDKTTFVQKFGLEAFKLFSDYKMALFFIFSMFLGGALQLTNAYGDVFLDEFKMFPKYADLYVVKRSTLILSISQISETLFILAIPFFLKRFGIKKVMVIAMTAWVLRFGLFAFGNPADGLWMIILSCIVYGMAFDFFNISGSLFVETSTTPKTRSSAQGLFMMMTNGFGAVFGSLVSGWMIDRFFTKAYTNIQATAELVGSQPNDQHLLTFLSNKGINVLANGDLSRAIDVKDWHSIWLSFTIYALIITVLFALMFKHKHTRAEQKAIEAINH